MDLQVLSYTQICDKLILTHTVFYTVMQVCVLSCWNRFTYDFTQLRY